MLTLIPFELSMAKESLSGKLTVILHADVAGSTALVHQDEQLAHERIQGAFHRFGTTITKYHGRVRELRGDALLAEFERASDAVTAALVFQADQIDYNPHHPYYYLFYLGQSYYLEGNNERAIELMKRVVTRAPYFLPVDT